MISDILKKDFLNAIDFDPIEEIKIRKAEQLPVDYFDFYNAISSVYSSKIEGEEIDFDSFFKHKFLKVQYNPDYTKKSEDLFNAYKFIQNEQLTENNLFSVHEILSQNLLPQNQRGRIRINPMFVINDEDRIEFVACEPLKLKAELSKFFESISNLLEKEISDIEVFFYASQIHLAFVKIHPMQDGNGRTARLLEKWFLIEKLGKDVVSVELEKNYYKKRKKYYENLRMLGLEYNSTDWNKALPFLMMTILSLKKQK